MKYGHLYGISLFLRYFNFKFLDNKEISLTMFALEISILAVSAKRNYSLDRACFENGFCLFVQFAQFWLCAKTAKKTFLEVNIAKEMALLSINLKIKYLRNKLILYKCLILWKTQPKHSENLYF